jgi:group I intron endonuclease
MEQPITIFGYVYLITNLVNGKKYVGCTKVSIKQRWEQHRSKAKKNSHFALHAAIRKYGVRNFRIEVIQEVEGTHDDLMVTEIHHIAAHDSFFPAGYNLTAGGDGVDHSIPEVQKRQVEGNRRRSSKSSWQKNQIEGGRKRSQDPEWQKANLEGAHRRSADPKWRLNTIMANRRNVFDPRWQQAHIEGVQRRSENPEWVKNVAEGAHKRAADPIWQKRHREGCRIRSSSSAWKIAHAEGIRRVTSTQGWKEAHAKGVLETAEISRSKADARWALLPFEEQQRRLRRRERDRKKYLAKKAKEIVSAQQGYK